MKTMTAVFAVVVLVACGGGDVEQVDATGSGVDNRTISPEFAGEWKGSASLAIAERPQGERPVTVSIRAEVNGPSLDVSVRSLCGTTPTDLHATGNGRATMWYGNATCPVALDGCPESRVDFRSAILRVLDDGRFYLLLNGTAIGCGQSNDAQVEVYASK